MRTNCLLKQVIEGKIKGRIEVTRRRGRRRKRQLEVLREKIRQWFLKEEAVGSTLWRTRFGIGYGHDLRQNADLSQERTGNEKALEGTTPAEFGRSEMH